MYDKRDFRLFFVFLFVLLFLILPVSAITWTQYGDAWSGVDGTDLVIKWNNTGNHMWLSTGNATYVSFLVIGGGGAGGAYATGGAGGGGAGGFINGSTSVSGLIRITVGNGGQPVINLAGLNGENSSFMNTTPGNGNNSAGGGGGAYYAGFKSSGDGASGGGGSGHPDGIAEGLRIWGQGFYGGKGNGVVSYSGGGGGGAGGNGTSASVTGGGNGGPGNVSLITGEFWQIAAGGGGSGYAAFTDGTGGAGGGGNSGDFPVNGTNQTGSGGGGSSNSKKGGTGGSGMVIIRYFNAGGTPTPTPTPTATAGPGAASSTNIYGVLDSCNAIRWTLAIPPALDFNGTMVYRNGTFAYNLTNASSSDTWTGLYEAVDYTISTKAFYLNGTSNTTWLNATSHTALCHCWYCGIFTTTEPEPTIPNLPAVHDDTWGMPGWVMRNAWWLILLIGAIAILKRK